MKAIGKIAALVLPVVVAAGCDDFLTGAKLDNDPNRPSVATRDQLFVAVQASMFTWHTGHMSRVASMWMQSMAGTDRQYQSLDVYDIAEDDFTTQFDRIYSGGGLVDLRKIQSGAEADGDRVYSGIAKVWEAYLMGMAASVWGDIPYSEAVGEVKTPKLDRQADVYAAVQTLLDQAIADLQSNTGRGPASADLIYAGNTGKWVRLARTLKARFYLHLAETTPANYGLALAQATQGIASSADDFRTVHGSASTENNMWFQFFRDRDSYTRAGRFMVELLKTRNDPRLAAYYRANQGGQFVGATPGEGVKAEHSLLSTTRGGATYRQPMVTWAETQLIIAEAAYRTNDQTAARNALNAVRTAAGLSAVATSVSGDALFNAIMEEKYIEMFQNLESWNDYKRTCRPALTPAAGKPRIPGRFLYGQGERNANPNVPAPSAQPARNANDPNACT